MKSYDADKKDDSDCEIVCLDVSFPHRVLRKPIFNRPWQAVNSNMGDVLCVTSAYLPGVNVK